MSRVLVINSPVQSCCGLPKNSCKCFKATKLRWQELPINNVFDPNQPRDTNTGRWVKSGSVHSVLREFDLGDDQNVLIATDALRDAGFDREAEALGKLLGTGMYKELNIKEFSRKHAIAHQVAEAIEDKEELWTRKRANNEKGYNARKAKELLDRNPDTELVVISDSAPTHQGLLIIKRPGGPDKAVLYYRKSSGGKYGRSSQLVYVRPNNPLTNADGENCGTGAGGFQPGNDCAKKAGYQPKRKPAPKHSYDSAEGMAGRLGLPKNSRRSYYGAITGSVRGPVRSTDMVYKVGKAALAMGFVLTETGRISHDGYIKDYEHPEGHTLQLQKRDDWADYHFVFVKPEHREGVAVSKEADQLTDRLVERVGWSKFMSSDGGVSYAREGNHKGAAHAHEATLKYITEDFKREKIMDQEATRMYREAVALHGIAADYHKEKAGLQ